MRLATDMSGHLVLSVKTALAASLAWLLVLPLRRRRRRLPLLRAPRARCSQSPRRSRDPCASRCRGWPRSCRGRRRAGRDAHAAADRAGDRLVVVLVGAAGWPRVFGASASWVPIAGLFVLIVDGGDPVDYATAYLGLVALGVVVGVGPQRRVPAAAAAPDGRLRRPAPGPARRPARRPRRGTAQRGGAQPPTSGGAAALGPAHHRGSAAGGRARDRRAAGELAGEALGADHAERRYQQARALQQVAFLIEDLTALVVDQEHADRQRVALGPDAPAVRGARPAGDGPGAALVVDDEVAPGAAASAADDAV